jgi:cyanate lyase
VSRDGTLAESAPMTRADVTAEILAAKRREGLSWTDLASRTGADRVWLTAALLGQHPVPPDLARGLGDALGLSDQAVAILQEIPTRGSFDALPPTDPTIYRLYEVLQVYGPALKALIHEDFGDGIMSAINFNLALERGEAESGPRVRISLDGKWLAYQWKP